MLQINNFPSLVKKVEYQEYFTDAEQLKELKLRVIRNAFEEVLRRSFNTEKEAEAITTTLLDHLYDGHNELVDDLFERKKAQLLKELEAGQNLDSLQETFKKYQTEVNKLKKNFGYSVEDKNSSKGVFVINENGFSVW